jgi:serine/threonine protein kinase
MNSPEAAMFENGFKVIETYHGGGMGLVHRARHLAWNIEVAIKHPRSEFLCSQDQIDEFQEECTKWEGIGLHPHVATCYYTKVMDQLPCVVAEFVPDGSLQDAITNRSLYSGEEEECLARILTIAASSAWGLARAHDEGLLHCDVKPGNMLLTSYGTCKISDFGLAVAFHPSKLDAKASGLTPAFASPEQIRGQPVATTADVWSWAASMLAMFTGGVTWESGAACGAVLRQLIDDGGKAYRIPAMPVSFAKLLGECLQFDPHARLSDFAEIAGKICELYEDHFGDSCPATRPDLELISADSLNNRAVSRFDLGDISAVNRLLDEALAVDPLHPEANFNAALLEHSSAGAFSRSLLRRLDQVTHFDLGEYRPWLYRACLLYLDGSTREAIESLEKTCEIAVPQEIPEIERIWELSTQRRLTPVLAPPISGEDLAHDSTRFARLMGKAELAISEGLLNDARRYLMMIGDISGFSRHPQRRSLLMKVNSMTLK